MYIESYEEFNNETKQYLNKVMDIYYTIQNKDITIKRYSLFEESDYRFSEFDKKILALFIAGFIVNGDLKDVLSTHNINIKYLFDFIETSENEIKSLNNDQYNDFYNSNFKSKLTYLMREKMLKFYINRISPKCIFSFLTESIYRTDILTQLWNKCSIPGMFFYDSPLFKSIEDSLVAQGDLEKKQSKYNSISIRPNIFGKDKLQFPTLDLNLMNTSENLENESDESSNLNEEEIWKILDEIQAKFIGQEVLAEHLFYNIINNQQLAKKNDTTDGERSVIFIDGPTGTGKTAITREITNKLNIPFISSSATNYSSTGYVGANITDNLKELYNKANGNLEKAQRGIIVFDEFDKIAYTRSGGLEMKKAVQQQLLDFMGGGKYTLHVGEGIFGMKKIEFDTSKLTFICLSALSDLRTSKTTKRKTVGFTSKEEIETDEYNITPQDLIGVGLERELVGRFNTYLHSEDYSKESLLKILKKSTISPMISFKRWIESKGKKLQIDDDVYNIVVEAAYELNTGARSLQTIMNNIRTYYLKKVLRDSDDIIYLDADTIKEITENTFSRKGRK